MGFLQREGKPSGLKEQPQSNTSDYVFDGAEGIIHSLHTPPVSPRVLNVTPLTGSAKYFFNDSTVTRGARTNFSNQDRKDEAALCAKGAETVEARSEEGGRLLVERYITKNAARFKLSN